ncbi:MAG: VanZ family protein [Oscillospiraceae bacterium]|nr:VanZ family protein [Oscillospiraceae bacterium]
MLSMLFDYARSFIQNQFPAVLIGTAAFLLLRLLLCRTGRLLRRSLPHEIGLVVFVLYLTTVLSLTFLPFRFDPGAGEFAFNSTLLAIARGTYTAGSWVWAMMLGNVLMLIPFGFLAPLLWEKLRWWRVLPVGLGFILAVELLQPLTGRSFDIDDILLNFLGVLAGALLSALVQALLPKQTAAFRA